MIWADLTSPELGRVPRHVPVVLPVAATEQHGPHLPLATDRLITERFAHLLDRRLGERVLVLPVVAVGCSEHHLSHPGTLSLSHESFLRVVEETLTTVAGHGFTNLVILNGHGGNSAISQVAVESFGHRHPHCKVITTTWWRIAGPELARLTETGPGGVGHACEFETSLLLHFAPERVRRELIDSGGNLPTFAWAEGDMLRGSAASLYRSFAEMTSNGVYGDPTAASAEKGAAIEDAVVAALGELIESLISAQASETTTQP